MCSSRKISKRCWALDTPGSPQASLAASWSSSRLAELAPGGLRGLLRCFVTLVRPSRSLHVYISLLCTHLTRHVTILNIHTTIIAFSFQFTRSQFPSTDSTTPVTHNLWQCSEAQGCVSLKQFLVYGGTSFSIRMLLVSVYGRIWWYIVIYGDKRDKQNDSFRSSSRGSRRVRVFRSMALMTTRFNYLPPKSLTTVTQLSRCTFSEARAEQLCQVTLEFLILTDQEVLMNFLKQQLRQ